MIYVDLLLCFSTQFADFIIGSWHMITLIRKLSSHFIRDNIPFFVQGKMLSFLQTLFPIGVESNFTIILDSGGAV